MSPLEIFAVFVVLPAGIFALITGLVVLPGLLRGPRYRPVRGWGHDPVWFAGPEQTDDETEVPAASADDGDHKGGASGSW